MGWTQLWRLDACSDALEDDVQRIFDAWGSDNMSAIVAGAPDWLWELGRPETRKQRIAYGRAFTPDVLWRDPTKAVVAELKYGTKYEPMAIGEVVHHAHILRQLDGHSEVTPVAITQYDNWLRAAAHDLKNSSLRHLEIDLLEAPGQKILWVTDPHAAIEACVAPKELPLNEAWSKRKWWRITGEDTWFVQEQRPQQPFNVGRLALISRVRSTTQGYVLWSGQMPARDERWSAKDWDNAGTYWHWSPQGDSTGVPPLP